MTDGNGESTKFSFRCIFSIRISPLVSLIISDNSLPAANPSSFMSNWLLKIRGDVSDNGGVLSGNNLGAINHKKRIPTPPTIATGNIKSNIEKSRIPVSRARPTTNKFVEVPMVVDMPPMIAAKPIGIITLETGNLVLNETPTNIGINRTMIGVLFIKALNTLAVIIVSKSANTGQDIQALLISVARG